MATGKGGEGERTAIHQGQLTSHRTKKNKYNKAKKYNKLTNGRDDNYATFFYQRQ